MCAACKRLTPPCQVERVLVKQTPPPARSAPAPLTALAAVHDALKRTLKLLAQLQHHVQHGASAAADVASKVLCAARHGHGQVGHCRCGRPASRGPASRPPQRLQAGHPSRTPPSPVRPRSRAPPCPTASSLRVLTRLLSMYAWMEGSARMIASAASSQQAQAQAQGRSDGGTQAEAGRGCRVGGQAGEVRASAHHPRTRKGCRDAARPWARQPHL
jgi:hypothetical protein